MNLAAVSEWLLTDESFDSLYERELPREVKRQQTFRSAAEARSLLLSRSSHLETRRSTAAPAPLNEGPWFI